MRTGVRAQVHLDVRGACVRPKKRSQLTPCLFGCFEFRIFVLIISTVLPEENNYNYSKF